MSSDPADAAVVYLLAGRVPIIGTRRSLHPGQAYPIQQKSFIRSFLGGLPDELKRKLGIHKVDIAVCGFDKLPVRIARGSIDRDTGQVTLVE